MLNISNKFEHENIVIKHDRELGFVSIIAIHNTKNGPALGGCRYVKYDSINEAISDALRLSKAMTYKSAMAGLPLGGGKAVIMSYSDNCDRERLFRRFASVVKDLNGKYITASDSGTTEDDMKIIAEETDFVTSIKSQDLISDDTADKTAEGVLNAIKAAVKHKLKKSNLENVTVAIQGIGSVGILLSRKLKKLGAELIISDIDESNLKLYSNELNAQIVNYSKIYDVDADVFAPSALGGILNKESIKRLKVSIICGAANNQILEADDADLIHKKGILYVPDYVANAGGVICAAAQSKIITKGEMHKKLANIYNSVLQISEMSEKLNISPVYIANQLAEKHFQ